MGADIKYNSTGTFNLMSYSTSQVFESRIHGKSSVASELGCAAGGLV